MDWESPYLLLLAIPALLALMWIEQRSSHPMSSARERMLLVALRTPVTLGAWIACTASILAEYIPSNSLKDLTAAEFIAVGQFVSKQGKIEFQANRMIKGDAVAGMTPMNLHLEANRDLVVSKTRGGLVFCLNNDGMSMPTDAQKSAVWFVLKRTGLFSLDRQPAELADGFADIVGRKVPTLLFRLLQDRDSAMHRDALEELHAKADEETIEKLHSLSLDEKSDLAYSAFEILSQTKLVNLDRYWGKWSGIPEVDDVWQALWKRDASRAMVELRSAIAAEKNPDRLEHLLYLIPDGPTHELDLSLQYLNHPSEVVRSRVIGNVWNQFWHLNSKAFSSAEAQKEMTALGKRIIPLLDNQLQVESDPGCKNRLTQMLVREAGTPWILRIPREQIDEPIPPYSEDEELKFLVSRLTSHGEYGFITETAGREIAERFFDEGFKQLKAAGASKNYNTDMVYDGMGYVRDQRMLDYLVSHLAEISCGERTYQPTLRALGVQNNRASLAAIVTPMIDENNDWQIGGLAVLQDDGVLPYLKAHESEIKYHAQVPYLRSRAMHGDPWAVKELLAAFSEPPTSTFLTKGFWNREGVANALCALDGDEITDALKRFVDQSWPTGTDARGLSYYHSRLENYAGTSRRSTPLAEVARRDPQWLAALALRKMADKSLTARRYGANIFTELTGHAGEFSPDAFARDRIEPLKKIEAWWAAHDHESREQWLAAYFREKGFVIDHFDKTSLPVLAEALRADLFTHRLAVEQISAICQKYFTEFPHYQSYQKQERMTVRVLGWLRARGYLAPAK